MILGSVVFFIAEQADSPSLLWYPLPFLGQSLIPRLLFPAHPHLAIVRTYLKAGSMFCPALAWFITMSDHCLQLACCCRPVFSINLIFTVPLPMGREATKEEMEVVCGQIFSSGKFSLLF